MSEQNLMSGGVVLENEFARAVYSPSAGASLRSLRVQTPAGATELITGGDESLDHGELPSGTGCFIMAPWPNRIRDGVFEHEGRPYSVPVSSPPHAIHGTVRRRAFEVLKTTETSATFSIDLGDDWPFAGSMFTEVALEGSSLVQSIEIRAAEKSFPAGFGWHPWFRRSLGSEAARVKAAVEGRWVLDGEMTPTGEVVEPMGEFDLREGLVPAIGSLDDCYRMVEGGEVSLTWPEVTLTIASSDQVGHLQVYSPEGSICVESQTAAVNAFQLAVAGVTGTGTVVVSPDEPLRGSTRWSWRPS